MTRAEQTRLEQIAGKRARIRHALQLGTKLHEIFSMFDRRAELVSIDNDVVTVKVTSSQSGESTFLKEPLLDFPSDTLVAQCIMVAG
jgi:hypothetical protein